MVETAASVERDQRQCPLLHIDSSVNAHYYWLQRLTFLHVNVMSPLATKESPENSILKWHRYFFVLMFSMPFNTGPSCTYTLGWGGPAESPSSTPRCSTMAWIDLPDIKSAPVLPRSFRRPSPGPAQHPLLHMTPWEECWRVSPQEHVDKWMICRRSIPTCRSRAVPRPNMRRIHGKKPSIFQQIIAAIFVVSAYSSSCGLVGVIISNPSNWIPAVIYTLLNNLYNYPDSWIFWLTDG